MKYKALMIDVDGTLAISQENTMPSSRVTQAINKAKDKIHIGVATGRPLFLIEDILSHLELSGPSIVNDGGIVIDISTRKIHYERLLTKDHVDQAVTILTTHKIPFYIHDNDKDILHTDDYVMERPINIFTAGVHESIAERALQEIQNLPMLHANKYISWMNGLTGILVSNAEATKQHGIMEVAKALNISTHEIIGVGDGYNDFPLLMACGLKIAMGNAVPELKEIADYIAPTVEEDGVADVIEKFILNS
jgi:hypothetical protein